MQILVAIDDAERPEEIVRLGALVREMTAGSLTLLAVAEDEKKGPEAEAQLQQTIGLIGQNVSDILSRIRVGKQFEEIVAEAGKGYDLLVMGERPHKNIFQRFTKLPTERILANIPCPILLSRGATRPLRRILVCESGREPSLLSSLLSQMSVLFNQIEDVTVLHVMSQIAAAPGIAGWELRADAEELIEKQTPEGNLLEDELAQLDRVDVEPTAKIRHGLVVEEILAEAQSGDYDLIVIGAHPGEGWERFLLDDLAKEIILKVERPLLVMKR